MIMRKPFVIEFDFPLENTSVKIHLRAITEPNAKENSFLVHSFCSSSVVSEDPRKFLLPCQHIMYVNNQGTRNWVHTDSQKETLLSMAIGEAIEKLGVDFIGPISIQHAE